MNAKEQAIAKIATLVETHHITLDELTCTLGRQQIEASKKDPSTLTHVFFYLGAIFILSGLGTYVATSWMMLNSTCRILVTLGPGVISLILAVVTALKDRRDMTVTTLIVLSAIFQPAGLFTAAYELSPGSGSINMTALVILAVLALQYGLFFLQLRLTPLLFFTIYFATGVFFDLCDTLHISGHLTGIVAGASLFALSYAIQRTPYNSICGFGYFVSSLLLLLVGFDWLKDTPFEIVYLALTGFMLYVSTIVRSRCVLATSTLAMFCYISYFTDKYFLKSLGWPLCLVSLGFLFFGIGNMVLKLHKRLRA